MKFAIIKITLKDAVLGEVKISRDPFNIGRVPGNDLKIDDLAASRNHCQIIIHDGEFALVDLGSTNGTFVNDSKIEGQYELKTGDVIVIGDHKLAFSVTQEMPAKIEDTSENRKLEVVKKIDEVGSSLRSDITNSPFSKIKSVVENAPNLPLEVNQTRRLGQNFFILFQLGKILISSSKVEDVFYNALNLIFEVVPAERGAIYLCEDGGEPTCYAHKIASKTDGVTTEEFRVSSTILTKAIEDKVGIITSDALSS